MGAHNLSPGGVNVTHTLNTFKHIFIINKIKVNFIK